MYAQVPDFILQQNWEVLQDYYATRCIITPLNQTVSKVNSCLIDTIPGDVTTSSSLDVNAGDGTEALIPGILDTFSIPNFPEHILHLKVGMPIILLHNLNIKHGLCNGT